MIRTEKKLYLNLWCGVETGLSLMELPLVPYGDTLMRKMADVSIKINNVFHNHRQLHAMIPNQ